MSCDFFCIWGFSFPLHLFFIWHGLKRLAYHYVRSHKHLKMLVFAFFILWEATDQRFRRVRDACLWTWRETCEMRIMCPCVCRSCFSEPWQKCHSWDLHIFLFLHECLRTFITEPMLKAFLVYLHQSISLSRSLPGFAIPTCLQQLLRFFAS